MAADVIVVGAGATGLMAACELLKAGKSVEVFDARPYAGGRMRTVHNSSFSIPLEAGAEFIHGNLPLTLSLLKKFGINYHKVEGEMWQVQHHDFKKEKDLIEDNHHRLVTAFNALQTDLSVEDFLNRHFNEEKDEALKKSVIGFVEGYDTADITRASALSFKKEWLGMGEGDDQYRVEGGYGELADALANECISAGGRLHLSTVVTKIEWKKNEVEVISETQKRYRTSTAVITLPAVLLADSRKQKGTVAFVPEIPELRNAAKQLGYGGVIKFILQFREPFWKSAAAGKVAGRSLDNLGFLFSNAKIPTWWTQLPETVPVLTGWLGGPAALKYISATEHTLLNEALNSLAFIFKMQMTDLKQLLTASQIINWCEDPFSRGSYSYDVVNGSDYKKILRKALDDTLYFAGESLSTSDSSGTVEAALSSGKEVSEIILKQALNPKEF